MEDREFTIGDVARICGVPEDIVSQWLMTGYLEGRIQSNGQALISREHLLAVMQECGVPLSRLEASAPTILVVDDDPYYLDIIPAVLSQEGGYTVLTASTGFEAGLLVVEHAPHVVILDIHLSDIDGRMVGERIKKGRETRFTRILGISGFLDEDEIAALSGYGFDDFLKKPFQIEDLRGRVRNLLPDVASDVL